MAFEFLSLGLQHGSAATYLPATPRGWKCPSAALDKAEQAALAAVGPGVVTGTEVDDEESKYEVEVTLDSGGEVDVQLDAGLQVVGRANDGYEDESED